jgi:hypothetical protein
LLDVDVGRNRDFVVDNETPVGGGGVEERERKVHELRALAVDDGDEFALSELHAILTVHGAHEFLTAWNLDG